MEYNIREIVTGQHDGAVVWVCDHRLSKPFEKPIRHVKPTRVQIVPRTNERVYWTDSIFKKIDAKGGLVKTPIAPFDNTGYRTLAGHPLRVFDNERECNAAYVSMSRKVLEKNQRELDVLSLMLQSQRRELAAIEAAYG